MSFLLAYFVARSIGDYVNEPMTKQKSNLFLYVSLPICLLFFGFVFWGLGAPLGSILIAFAVLYAVALAITHCGDSKEDKQCKPAAKPALAPKLNPMLDKPAPYRYY